LPQCIPGRQPRARLEFAKAAVIAKLNIEAAERRGFAEHLALDPAGLVPAGPATGGGVHRKHQAPAFPGGFDCRRRPDFFDERVDRGLARFLWEIFVCVGHASCSNSLCGNDKYTYLLTAALTRSPQFWFYTVIVQIPIPVQFRKPFENASSRFNLFSYSTSILEHISSTK
jgi:hypothetical protein